MTTPTSDDREDNRRQRVWLVVGGAVVLVALFAVWLIAGRGDGQPVAVGTQSAATTAGPTAQPTAGSESSKGSKATPKPSGTATTSGSTLKEMSPVGLDSEADRPDGVVIALRKIESIAGEAKLPGEIAGPALRLTITIQNGTNNEVSLDSVVVNGYRGAKRTPLEMLTSPGGSPFTGSLKPGEQAEAIYIFAVDAANRSDVTFTVDATPGQPAAVFRGDAR